jgi:hypothetical protein
MKFWEKVVTRSIFSMNKQQNRRPDFQQPLPVPE